MAKKERRRLILDAALEIFAERGLVSPPIPTITSHAGVATGTIYSYFKSRDDLIQTLFNEVETQLVVAILNDEDAFFSCCTTVERIRSHMAALVKFFLEDRNRFFFYYNFHNSPYGASYRKKRGEIPHDLGSTLSPLFQAGIDAGVIVDIPIDILFKFCVELHMAIVRDHFLAVQLLTPDLLDQIISMSLKSITK